MGINLQTINDFFSNWKSGLGDERIFISENDLVLSFALYVKEHFKEVKINFELPFNIGYTKQSVNEPLQMAGNSYLDLHLYIDNLRYGFEFKYHTCRYPVNTSLYNFELKDHIARDVLRFNFRKDIYRLEYLRNRNEHFKIDKGFAILLTNDCALINTNAGKETLDGPYRFSESSPIRGGDARWNAIPGKKSWVIDAQFDIMLPLKEEGYNISWSDYHKTEDPKKDFKYCAVEI